MQKCKQNQVELSKVQASKPSIPSSKSNKHHKKNKKIASFPPRRVLPHREARPESIHDTPTKPSSESLKI
jgi:hypothetical protein